MDNRIKKKDCIYDVYENNSKDNKIYEETNPNNFNFLKYLTKDSFTEWDLDNSFTVFKSINNILYLIYSNYQKSIITYNLINNNKINEIKNAHNMFITNFRHYIDKNNKKDLIISISSDDNNIKLWNINNYECLLNIQNINKNGRLYSASFLNNNNKIYIITSNYNDNKYTEPIRIFDLNGNKINEINDSNYNTFFIDVYCDKNLNKNYILSGNSGFTVTYDYFNNKIYHKYKGNNDDAYFSIIVYNKDEELKIIASNSSGEINIWNFHSGFLLKKINVTNRDLRGICLWNNDYLFVGSVDNIIKLIDINKGKNINDFFAKDRGRIITLKKLIIPKYGECLIFQGWHCDQIKLFSFNI